MRIAVTGSTGRLGGQVVRLLAAQGSHDVVALARRASSPDWPSARVLNRTADYDDPAALRAALRDVDTLVFVSSDGEAVGVMLHHQNVIEAAADCGVAHVVALSGLDADPNSPFCYGVTYGHTERLLRASGCALSIARASIWPGQARSRGGSTPTRRCSTPSASSAGTRSPAKFCVSPAVTPPRSPRCSDRWPFAAAAAASHRCAWHRRSCRWAG